MMYLLTETAIGDSTNYEVLSFDEVERLKKERSLLSNRIDSTKRRLAMETKIRDAAQSLGRLYSPPSPRSSGEYGANGSDKSHRSIFGRSGAAEALDKSDSELAMSQRRCEELAQELWKLERKSTEISQRLLDRAGSEHRAARGIDPQVDGLRVDRAQRLDEGRRGHATEPFSLGLVRHDGVVQEDFGLVALRADLESAQRVCLVAREELHQFHGVAPFCTSRGSKIVSPPGAGG